jgi:hypothetical protein
MNKLAEEFVLKTAKNLSTMFPELMVRYEYQNFHKTHWIQILEEDIISKRPDFVNFYIKTVEEFENMFQEDGEELGFLTDDILIKLKNPIYSYIPTKITKQNIQKVSSAKPVSTVNAGERTYAMAA